MIATLAAATAAWPQADPETERGIKPGAPYVVEGLDKVNIFNGNVTLNLPIGQQYNVSSTLSYGLIASYASNPWGTGDHELEYPDIGEDDRPFTYHYKFPAKYQNAGLGWIVGLGSTYVDRFTLVRHYLAPDGSRHAFYAQLHQETDVPGVSYTRDGSYLRHRTTATGGQVEFPDGEVHYFDSQGRLVRMEDAYPGNWVKVEYKTRGQLNPNDSFPQSTVWVITDSVRDPQGTGANAHYVYFQPGWTYREDDWYDENVTHELLDKIVLTAFDNPGTSGPDRSTYTFNYDALPPNKTPENRTARKCGGLHPEPNIDPFEYVAILKSISMPEGVTYAMEYDRGNPQVPQPACKTTAGEITRLTLPNLGVIEWTYQNYGFRMAMSTGNVGVHTRTARASLGGATLSTTLYELGVVTTTQPFPDKFRLVTQKDGSGAVINATKHYFGGCNDRYCTYSKEYALPFTRSSSDSASGAFLSTETMLPNAAGALEVKRRRYVRYEGDRPLQGIPGQDAASELNQRMFYERTVFLDDNNRWADTTHSEFDGLGHYRMAVTDGNFAASGPNGHGNKRTTFTNYNPEAGTFAGDGSGFTLPPHSERWVLTTYDKQWVMEPDASGAPVYSNSRFCFDHKGFLTMRRIYKNYETEPGVDPDEDPADLVTRFTADSTTGNPVKEQYWGGSDLTAAPSHDCEATYSNESYRIDRTWKHGILESAYYATNSGTQVGPYITDNVIDQSTGLTSAQRRFRTPNGSDGLTTTFNYDLLGRMTKSISPRLTTTNQYTMTPPAITAIHTATSGGAELRRSRVELDVLGRPIVESRSMPGSTTATRTTVYNALGWKTAITEWGASAPTQYTYDGFGRQTSIRQPGESASDAATITYTGASSLQRKTRVRTGGTATTFSYSDALTDETYDRHGRLTSVREPAPASGSRPLTKYTYDVGGRLTGVCANFVTACGQTREFNYDNRGLLESEVHPENGTTNYKAYDARGHLRRRHGGTQYAKDVTFDYDRAERLTDVRENLALNDSRTIKHYIYATTNETGNHRYGRLTDAIRFNWTHNGYRVQVREEYEYGDGEGNISFRKTSDHICVVNLPSENCRALELGTPASSQRVFTQTFEYDALGGTKKIGYPNCDFDGCTSTSRDVTNTFDQGMLTGVTWTGAEGTSAIAYHPSGLVASVAHDNDVTDTQVPDPNIPSRPQSIVTTGARETAPEGCVAPTFSTQPLSQTIVSGSTATLTVLASGEDDVDISYHWFQGTAPSMVAPVGGDNESYTTLPLTSTTNYWVEARSSCGETASVTATISICTAPEITLDIASETITRGEFRSLSILSSGTGLHYQWFTVTGSAETAIPGATSNILKVYPETTTAYRVRVWNACDSDQSDGVITVLDPPTVPLSVVATYDHAGSRNVITWAPSTSAAGIHGYLVERQPGPVSQLVTSGTTYIDTDSLVAGTTYLYTIRSYDANGVYSAKSLPDIAIVKTFTDDPIAAPTLISGTLLRGIHIVELRQAVDSVRAAASLSPAWTSYTAPTGEVEALHFVELRARLNEARDRLLLPFLPLDPSVAEEEQINGTAITELRNGVK